MINSAWICNLQVEFCQLLNGLWLVHQIGVTLIGLTGVVGDSVQCHEVIHFWRSNASIAGDTKGTR